MDDLRKAAEMALEALEDSMYPQKKQFDAIVGLKQALAQPEQEPVAAVELITIGSEQTIAVAWHDSNAFKLGVKLYTTPPSKPWVGLENIDFQYQPPAEVITMKYAEAILKEKNT